MQIRFVLLFLLIIFSVGLVSQTKTNDLISSSYVLEASRNYQAALGKMKTLEKNDKNDAFYKLRIAWLNYLLMKYKDALEYYQKSYKEEPSLDAQEGMVNCYVAMGSWNDAILQASDILVTYPYYVNVLLKAGYASYMRKDYTQAIVFYKRVLAISPYSFEARGYLLASCYYNNNIPEAKKQYQFLLKYYPASIFVRDFSKHLG